jgi:TolA-binding protein
LAAAEPAAAAPVAPLGGAEESARTTARSTRPDGDSSWQTLARAGKFEKALGTVDVRGFGAECERASSEELALLADVARFGRRPQQAIMALSSLRRRFPSSSLASVAAFNIARVHFDQRGAYDDAARWFRVYLKEQPGGPLAREAQGRLMEAQYRGGDRASASRTADAYLAANPNGPHARLARTLLGR